MVYTMTLYTDGGCRRNGRSDAIGAAGAVLENRDGTTQTWNATLPSDPPPTNQRAEIGGIILALRLVLEKYKMLNGNPRLDVTIYTDSKYALGCMTDWIQKWTANGWVNSRGFEVANRDLIARASQLDDEVRELGCVRYLWIPRAENQDADDLCNRNLDKQEKEKAERTEEEGELKELKEREREREREFERLKERKWALEMELENMKGREREHKRELERLKARERERETELERLKEREKERERELKRLKGREWEIRRQFKQQEWEGETDDQFIRRMQWQISFESDSD